MQSETRGHSTAKLPSVITSLLAIMQDAIEVPLLSAGLRTKVNGAHADQRLVSCTRRFTALHRMAVRGAAAAGVMHAPAPVLQGALEVCNALRGCSMGW